MKINIDETTEEIPALEIYLSADSNPTVGEDGLVWKEILREGEWRFRPGPNQKPIEAPLRVVSGHASDNTEIGFADLQEAFEDGAVDHVTIPESHEDKPSDNTGFVRKLEIRGEEGNKKLYAGLDFTEPIVKEKALRGTIANTSVGVVFDYIKKSSGKVYKQVLGHVALTNKPWINGMQPFGVSASEDIEVEEIASVVIEPDDKVIEGLKIENVADFESAKDYIIARAKELGTLDWLPDDWQETPVNESVNSDASDNEENKETNMSEKDSSKDVKEDQGRLDNKPTSETVLSEDAINKMIEDANNKAMEAANLKLSELEEQNAALAKQLHEKAVAEKISELKEQGFAEHTGLLKTIEELYLADEGGSALTLNLSEDGSDKPTEVKLSVSDIVTRIVDSLPELDGSSRVNFGEQVNEFQNFDRPDSNSKVSSPEEKAAMLAEQLGIADYPTEEGK